MCLFIFYSAASSDRFVFDSTHIPSLSQTRTHTYPHTRTLAGARISRKHDYIPPLANLLSGGWDLPVEVKQEIEVRALINVDVCQRH